MEFAASCRPLRKSNSRATAISPTRTGSPSAAKSMGRSYVLDHHALKLIGNVVKPVDDFLEVIIDLLCGEEPHRVTAVPLEKRPYAEVMKIVGASFDLRNLFRDGIDLPRLLADRTEQRDRLLDQQRAFDDGVAHLFHFARKGANVEQHHGFRGFLHLVDGIVHRGDEILDGAAVEGRDEAAPHRGQDVAGDVVGIVLPIHYELVVFGDDIAALQQRTQGVGAGHDDVRMFGKQFEEPVIPRQQGLEPTQHLKTFLRPDATPSAARDANLHGTGWSRAKSEMRRMASSRACPGDRKSTRLNSSHGYISYAVFCLKKKQQHSNYPPQPKKKETDTKQP